MAGVYFIKCELPFPVVDENAVSKFKKTEHMLTITLPVVPPPCKIMAPIPTAPDISSVSALFAISTPLISTTTSSVVVDNPSLGKAAPVTSAEHKADIIVVPVVPVVPVAKSSKVKAVKSSVAKSIKANAAYRLSFDGFNKCMESFKNIKWNVDVHRKDSPGAGKGIFCLRPIKKSNCVALYFGHLVDDKGAVVVTCPSTSSLFKRLPIVQRPFSRGHGVNVNNVACPHILIVDGSHHACSSFDNEVNRRGVPWGSCLNSSDAPGAIANCQIVW